MKKNYREVEKRILDSIIGPGLYDSRIRPQAINSSDSLLATKFLISFFLVFLKDDIAVSTAPMNAILFGPVLEFLFMFHVNRIILFPSGAVETAISSFKNTEKNEIRNLVASRLSSRENKLDVKPNREEMTAIKQLKDNADLVITKSDKGANTVIMSRLDYAKKIHNILDDNHFRRLVANGLHSCRPLRRLPLTPPNRRQRLEWCRARSTWMTEWHRVVFSDESRFCLSSDSRRVRVWRRRGERSNPAAIVERPTVRQRGIMVWGAIAYDSRSPLLRIQGTMTAQRYVDDVLRPVTLPYLQGVPNALYQQDNARPHTARISQQALQDVQMLPWPPYSPDLSPIEHVWDIIGRRLPALPQPRSEDELWQMRASPWCIRGGPTCY
ncbi:hypothetical protein LAZ67_9001142 [Cordylochernes scorpioides]|uniref:Tc1-like transposase DDE domain-containing protein n=1 Tax=Cordylochernes scorpioides TaxID=51811 RepID=A0ABY6KTC6_9ARAC|nr:hypothetical protein LAZ67_9001142 [Cordylochernes scorpioides]